MTCHTYLSSKGTQPIVLRGIIYNTHQSTVCSRHRCSGVRGRGFGGGTISFVLSFAQTPFLCDFFGARYNYVSSWDSLQ